jgi:pilus assembly protein Flp/PilA
MLQFINDENGSMVIEYGLNAAMIAVGIIGAVSSLGTSVSSTFDTISSALTSDTGSDGTGS